ncbi:MAG: CehA/McbA family metallohydrolase [Deltaproteobacteria bacterium]|nr:CehA/McbA family metallohydrolase [Deltaproteobacteria bacterium]
MRRRPRRVTPWVALILVACAVPAVHRAPRRPARERHRPDLARAEVFRIASADDRIAGPAATGQIGDYRIDNGRVAFVVDALGRGTGFALGGGNVIDAGVVPSGRDALGHVFTYFGEFPRQAIYDRVALRQEPDGSAVIRVEGRDSKDPRLRVSTEYLLAPLVDFLEITTIIENDGPEEVELSLGDAIHWGGLEHFAPGQGFHLSREMDVPFVAGVGGNVSVGYGSFDDRIGGPSGSSWTDTVLRVARIPPGRSVEYDRVLVVSDSADVTRVGARIRTLRGERLGSMEGRTVDQGGQPVAGARVELFDEAGNALQNLAESGDEGQYLLQAPAGRYRLRASAPGRRGAAESVVELVRGRTRRSRLRLSATSFLRYSLLEQGRPGGRVPGKITIEGIEGNATPDFGPPFRTLARNVLYTVTGHGSVPLAPGRYRATVSRGPEYAVWVREIDVPEGGEGLVEATLERVVDSTGYLCGDFHQHTVGSTDAATTVRDRMIANAGEGVEIVLASDHNYVNDFSAAIQNLGLEGEIFSISGNEITTDTSPKPVGHFNVFPLDRVDGAPDGGAWDVFGRTAAEIFAMATMDGQDRVIQVNHPRSPDNGYFALAGYDPLTNAGRPGEFSAAFDTIEVFNGGRIDAVPGVLTDVYSMWNRGLTPSLTGSSDTHAIVGEEPGFPRTCLALGDDVSALTARAVVDALKVSRNGFVTNGPFVRMKVAGVDIGGLVQASPGRIPVEVEVQAAPWVDVTTIQLVVNGEPDDPVDLEHEPESRPRPVVRYRGTLRPRLWRDSWLQLIVRGEGTLEPVVRHDPPDGPLALTNPIWVDVDGNGRFDPPLEVEAAAPPAARPAARGASRPRPVRRPPAAPLPRVNPADR